MRVGTISGVWEKIHLKSLTSAIYAPIPNPGKIAAAIAILQIPKIIQLIYSGKYVVFNE